MSWNKLFATDSPAFWILGVKKRKSDIYLLLLPPVITDFTSEKGKSDIYLLLLPPFKIFFKRKRKNSLDIWDNFHHRFYKQKREIWYSAYLYDLLIVNTDLSIKLKMLLYSSFYFLIDYISKKVNSDIKVFEYRLLSTWIL